MTATSASASAAARRRLRMMATGSRNFSTFPISLWLPTTSCGLPIIIEKSPSSWSCSSRVSSVCAPTGMPSHSVWIVPLSSIMLYSGMASTAPAERSMIWRPTSSSMSARTRLFDIAFNLGDQSQRCRWRCLAFLKL